MRDVYHVTPFGNSWKVTPEGAATPLAILDNKNAALDEAKRLAKAAKLGQVVVHGSDGRIQEEFTYGKDPRDVPG